jgi:hypothetical protein
MGEVDCLCCLDEAWCMGSLEFLRELTVEEAGTEECFYSFEVWVILTLQEED